jgi:hypothetical protein
MHSTQTSRAAILDDSEGRGPVVGPLILERVFIVAYMPNQAAVHFVNVLGEGLVLNACIWCAQLSRLVAADVLCCLPLYIHWCLNDVCADLSYVIHVAGLLPWLLRRSAAWGHTCQDPSGEEVQHACIWCTFAAPVFCVLCCLLLCI